GSTLNVGTGQSLSATFTPTDTANYTTASKTVTINVSKATPTITWPAPADIVFGTPLSATQLNPTTNGAGPFDYSRPTGTVLDAGTQPLSVTFTPTNAANYAVTTASVNLNVLKATPTITWPTPGPISFGTPLGTSQLNAAATTSTNPSVGSFALSGQDFALAGLLVSEPDAGPSASYDISGVAGSISKVAPAAPARARPVPGTMTHGPTADHARDSG